MLLHAVGDLLQSVVVLDVVEGLDDGVVLFGILVDELLVDDETIAQRKAKGVNAPVRQLDGYLKRYAKLVTSSNTGAVFED